MVILALIVGSALGAIGGLAIGDMVKFSIEGEAINLRYIGMLFGLVVGYGIAWLMTRFYRQHDHEITS